MESPHNGFDENQHKGWIKLYRSIRKHWIYEDSVYFKAWCDILLKANHKDHKKLFGKDLIECKRGQAIYSIGSWVRIFGKDWSRQKVRTFLTLLEREGMIITKGVRNTTILTVINYDAYQDRQPTDNQPITNPQPTDNQPITTIEEVKEVKNEKKKDSPLISPQGEIPFGEIISDLNEQTEKNYRITEENKKLIRARWKSGFRIEDFKRVHKTMSIKWKNDPEWNKFLRPATLYRASKFEGYLNEKDFRKNENGAQFVRRTEGGFLIYDDGTVVDEKTGKVIGLESK